MESIETRVSHTQSSINELSTTIRVIKNTITLYRMLGQECDDRPVYSCTEGYWEEWGEKCSYVDRWVNKDFKALQPGTRW